jgi:hypothetical protein
MMALDVTVRIARLAQVKNFATVRMSFKGGGPMRLNRIVKALALALIGTCAAVAVAGERTSVIAFSGQAAPGQQGLTFQSVDYAAINNAGQIVFNGKLQGESVTPLNDTGYFIGTAPSSLALAAREGDPIENYPGGMLGLSSFWPTSFSDSGQLAFRGNITTITPVFIGGIFLTGPTGTPVRALAVAGQNYPDGSGEKWGSNVGVALNGGTAAVVDRYKSVWSGSSPEKLTLVARSGDKVGDETIYEIRPGQVRIAQGGLTVFDAQLTPDGTAASARGAILAAIGAAGPITIFKAGQLASNAPAETRFEAFTLQGLSRGGQTLIHAALTGPGITTSNDRGLWLAPNPASMSPLGPAKIVQEGDPAPGMGPSAKFLQVYDNPILTGDGRAVFEASTSGGAGNTFGVWEARAHAQPQRLIGPGDSAAGLPAGVTIQSIYYRASNAAGQSTFGVPLTGAGVGQSNAAAIIGYDPTLGRVLLVRQGDSVEIAPGDVRIIKEFGLSFGGLGRMPGGTGHDGLITPLNDAGVVAFQATFTDDTQAILTARVPVAGDATNDGVVNGEDFQKLFENFGKTFDAGDRSKADFDLDGSVSFGDFQMLERNFGYAPPGISARPTPADYAQLAQFAAAVPEPGTLAFIAAMAASALKRRRGHQRF